MKEKPVASNIFDVASKTARSKPKPRSEHLASPPPTEPQKNAQTNLTNEEVQKMFQRMHEIHDAINKKLDELYERAGVSHKRIVELAGKLGKNQRAEVVRLQQEHNALEEKVWTALGFNISEKKKQKEDNKTKKRRAKTIGARRRWIEAK
jgi:hypothetical protein